jgi:hypothetical protein
MAFCPSNAATAHSVTLTYPDPTKTLCVFTDASDLHWSGVITQCNDDQLNLSPLEQDHQPLAFISGNFYRITQLNWPTVEQEAFAIKDADGYWLYSDDAMYVPDLESLSSPQHLRLCICIVAHQGPGGHRGSILMSRTTT